MLAFNALDIVFFTKSPFCLVAEWETRGGFAQNESRKATDDKVSKCHMILYPISTHLYKMYVLKKEEKLSSLINYVFFIKETEWTECIHC